MELEGFSDEDFSTRVISASGTFYEQDLLEYLDWHEAGALITSGLGETIKKKTVTYDLARQMDGATELKTSQFADAIIANM